MLLNVIHRVNTHHSQLESRWEEFSDTSDEFTLGWKWELRPRGVLEIGLIENVLEFDN